MSKSAFLSRWPVTVVLALALIPRVLVAQEQQVELAKVQQLKNDAINAVLHPYPAGG